MNHHDDHQLDARVRGLPVPAGRAGRVAPEALFDDAAIDRVLVRVDPPPGLQDRVREATAAMLAGAALPLSGEPRPSPQAGSPGHGGGRLSSSVRRLRLWPAAMDLLADGGAVVAALSIVALMFFAGTELSRRLAAPASVQQRVAVRGPSSQRPDPARGNTRVQRAQPSAEASADASAGKDSAGKDSAGKDSAGKDSAGGDSGWPDGALPRAADVAGGIRAPAGAAAPVADAAARVSQPPTAAGVAVEVRASPATPGIASGDRGVGTTGIRTVFLPLVGRQVPRVPGYDIAFEMAHGESPFVDPSVAATLAVDRPPLSLRTESFESLCETARRGRGQPTARRPRRGGMPLVRTEDILTALPATLSNSLPNSLGDRVWSGMGPGLGLSLTAVRSLRPAPDSMFVEVCATAPPLPAGGTAAESAPLDVMLMLDQSAGPFASLSWQWLCRGLDRVIGQMQSADRLSLIVCGERPRLVALRADAAALAALLPELMREPVARSADFDAAFRLVAAVGSREGRPDRIVAAAHADTLERCRREGRAAFSAWQADLAAATPMQPSLTTAFVLIDPQESLPAGGSPLRATPLVAGRIAADPIAISRVLVGRVFDRPTLAATGCRLEVAFDPGLVGSYRIVGHRQTAADALASVDPRGIDLHAGETTRVVYEVIRRPGGTGALLPGGVSASLTWTPAGAGPEGVGREGPLPEQTVRKVLADDGTATADLRGGLPSPHGCELLLAVALGELAAASVHAEPWRQSAAGIAALASRWRARGDVTPIGRQLIDCLEHQGIIPDAGSR